MPCLRRQFQDVFPVITGVPQVVTLVPGHGPRKIFREFRRQHRRDRHGWKHRRRIGVGQLLQLRQIRIQFHPLGKVRLQDGGRQFAGNLFAFERGGQIGDFGLTGLVIEILAGDHRGRMGRCRHQFHAFQFAVKIRHRRIQHRLVAAIQQVVRKIRSARRQPDGLQKNHTEA